MSLAQRGRGCPSSPALEHHAPFVRSVSRFRPLRALAMLAPATIPICSMRIATSQARTQFHASYRVDDRCPEDKTPYPRAYANTGRRGLADVIGGTCIHALGDLRQIGQAKTSTPRSRASRSHRLLHEEESRPLGQQQVPSQRRYPGHPFR